jgi:hypothetical protein
MQHNEEDEGGDNEPKTVGQDHEGENEHEKRHVNRIAAQPKRAGIDQRLGRSVGVRMCAVRDK